VLDARAEVGPGVHAAEGGSREAYHAVSPP